MEIKIINNQNEWDSWLGRNVARAPFTQSWAWGDVLLAEGKRVERLAVVEDEEVLAQAQIVYGQLPFGWQHAFCPRGPIESLKFKVESYKVYECLFDFLKNQNCIFLRIEPDSISNIQYPISNIKKTIDINPPATLILDLKKSEEELLAGMQPKTRYNIHLAEKKSLTVNEEKNLEVFWNLMNKTGSRDKFSLHHKKHYQEVLRSPLTRQLTAYENTKPIACAVFANFAGTFTYLYGASDYEYRNLMAPYLLQWAGIKIGKSLGCQWYDFFGVAPRCHSERALAGDEESSSKSTMAEIPRRESPRDDNYEYDSHHQYAGATRFKLGFGGAPYQTIGTFDVIINYKKYQFYNIIRKIRRLF